MFAFFTDDNEPSFGPSTTNATVAASESSSVDEEKLNHEDGMSPSPSLPDPETSNSGHNQDSSPSASKTTCELDFNFNDPGTWPETISDSQRCYIVKMRAENEYEPDLSKSLREGRTLTKGWFTRKLGNGTKVKRSWLGYSETRNALYCIPCRLFSNTIPLTEAKLSSLCKNEGFVSWKKLSDKIPDHDTAPYHQNCFGQWRALEATLLPGKGGIDKKLQDQINKEISHWKSVLHSIIDAILFLAKQGKSFRGTHETKDFGAPDSGSFLNTIDLISRYNVHLCQHIERHKKGQVSYFSHQIQDEFLNIIATEIRTDIVKDINNAKYYSLIFDCTPDISHNEQMTEILRYVKPNSSEVEESFLDFFTVSNKTGEGLTQEILEKVEKDGLDINNCRGQSYDNGANMAGKYKGVQARILEKNELAYFVPCVAHSLNLVGVHAADASVEAQSFFGTLGSLYNFFVASTSRWEILMKHVPTTLKSQSKTRWSARIEAVEAVYKHFGKVIEALEEILDHPFSSSDSKSESKSLLNKLKTFEFIVLCCFWYSQLKKIDGVNKFLQREDLTVDQASRNILGLCQFLKTSREYSPSEALSEAKLIAQMNDISPEFTEKRKRKRKTMYDELCEDEAVTRTPEELFIASMLQISDRLIMEMSTRFKSLENINDKFGFLNGGQINEMTLDDLKLKAGELADTYKEDLNKKELIFEIESFKGFALGVDNNLKTSSASTTLELILKNKLEEMYPNITTGLKIFLTLPVSVATGERSFSKLKLVKNHLRSSMSQQRLTDLSIITIEHKRASNISFDKVIKEFASKKSRKVIIRD